MAGMRETLSPLVRSPQARRLSLELCKNIASHLLSPSRAQQAVTSELSPFAKNPNPFFSPNGSKWSPHWVPGATAAGTITGLSPSANTYSQNRRGSLGCPSPFSGNGSRASPSKSRIKEMRRGSLNTTIPISTAFFQNLQIPSIRVDKVETRTKGLNDYFSQSEKTSVEEEDAVNDETNQKRRKSSSSRYGFDEEFAQLVAKKCQLFIDAEEVLGRGSFGTVVSGVYKGRPIAAKIVQTNSNSQIISISCEQNALELPPHPNVVRLIDIFQLGTGKAIIVMERLRKGNLLTILNDPAQSYFNAPTRNRIAFELASAIQFCHSNGILHLDVKPQNILVDFNGSCKLTDFGNSRRLSDLILSSSYMKLDGTVAYKAPELFRGLRPTDKADVYSYGITLWQILTREIPYDAENEHSVIYKVVAQGHRPRETAVTEAEIAKELKNIPNGTVQLYNYKNLYQYCWSENPDNRPDMAWIVNQLSSFLSHDRTFLSTPEAE